MLSEHPGQQPSPRPDFHITINGRPRVISQHILTYDDVVKLAYPNFPPNPDITYTVSYASPRGPDGTLAEGQSVEVKNDMSFTVGKTNRS
jgi:hypothetical protein